MATVLAILPEGFEEIEAITPIDIWRRAGMTVTVAALGSTLKVEGRNGIAVTADQVLSAVPPATIFDVLFLPGGPGVRHLRASREVRAILDRHTAANRFITAICAAPLVLHDAGLLAGRRFTAHPSTESELGPRSDAEPVVVDGRMITSRGAGTALSFALRVTAEVLNSTTAAQIALSICAQSAS